MIDLDSNERIFGSLCWLAQFFGCGWWGVPLSAFGRACPHKTEVLLCQLHTEKRILFCCHANIHAISRIRLSVERDHWLGMLEMVALEHSIRQYNEVNLLSGNKWRPAPRG